MRRRITTIALLLAGTCAVAAAKNVDLVTLPARQNVQLTIYNSEDITLVKETRYITFKKGGNRLQFSWANTLIDPTSVELRPLEHANEIELADTVFPGQKPQHLIWNIESRFEGQVKVEVTYFTSGLTWSMDYVAIADPDETVMAFAAMPNEVRNCVRRNLSPATVSIGGAGMPCRRARSAIFSTRLIVPTIRRTSAFSYSSPELLNTRT